MNAEKNKRLDLFLTDQANEDCDWWSAENPKLLKRINDLIDNCRNTPFSWIGKPEPLKYELSGHNQQLGECLLARLVEWLVVSSVVAPHQQGTSLCLSSGDLNAFCALMPIPLPKKVKKP